MEAGVFGDDGTGWSAHHEVFGGDAVECEDVAGGDFGAVFHGDEFFLTFGYDFFMACNKHNCIGAKSSNGENFIQTESREYNADNYLTSIVTDIKAETGKFETKFEFIPK